MKSNNFRNIPVHNSLTDYFRRAGRWLQGLWNHQSQAPHDAGLLMLAIVTLSGALEFAHGSYAPAAIGWLAAACLVSAWLLLQLTVKPWPLLIGLLIAAVALLGPFKWNQLLYQVISAASPTWWLWVPITVIPLLCMAVMPPEQARWKWNPPISLAVIILAELAILSLTHMGFADRVATTWRGEDKWVFMALSTITLLLIGLAITGTFTRQILFLMILVAQFYLGVWMFHLLPHPHIDTWPWGQKSAAALLHGHNPYRITIRDIYRPNTPYYAPGVVKDGRVMVGYVYPPLSLLTSTAGYLMGGDFRYAELAMLSISALLLALITDMSREGLLGAVMILFLPQAFYVLAMGWIEPCVLLSFMVLLLLAYRKPSWMGVGFALFLVSKQYVFLSAPLVIMLWPRPIRKSFVLRFCLQAAVTGCIINLPFLLWDPHAFFNSIVPRHIFRLDALSLASYWAHQTGHWPPARLWWGSVGLVNLLCLIRLPRRPWAFAFGTGCVYLTFFAGASEAFDNYYFLIICLFCVALALLLHEQKSLGPDFESDTVSPLQSSRVAGSRPSVTPARLAHQQRE